MPQARARQIDVVLLSEHEESGWTPEKYAEYVAACRAASTNDVQLVPGIEFNQDGFHVLCYGLQTFPARPSTAAELMAAVRAQGCWLCLAHPGKYRWQHPAALVDAANAVEVWNAKWIYDGGSGPHPASLRMAQGKQLWVGQDVLSPSILRHSIWKQQDSSYAARLSRRTISNHVSGQTFTPAQLRAGMLRQSRQRVRTVAMRAALIGYRLARGKHPFPQWQQATVVAREAPGSARGSRAEA
ncbi:MAG: hypothetical protein U0Y68_02270 [Blastocatellia bacterium]